MTLGFDVICSLRSIYCCSLLTGYVHVRVCMCLTVPMFMCGLMYSTVGLYCTVTVHTVLRYYSLGNHHFTFLDLSISGKSCFWEPIRSMMVRLVGTCWGAGACSGADAGC